MKVDCNYNYPSTSFSSNTRSGDWLRGVDQPYSYRTFCISFMSKAAKSSSSPSLLDRLNAIQAPLNPTTKP